MARFKTGRLIGGTHREGGGGDNCLAKSSDGMVTPATGCGHKVNRGKWKALRELTAKNGVRRGKVDDGSDRRIL
jgi:hypothetical protein